MICEISVSMKSEALLVAVLTLLCCLNAVTSESLSRIVRSLCQPDQYYDGVMDVCIPCSEICNPRVPPDFCNNNCPDFAARVLRSTIQQPAVRATSAIASSTSTSHQPAGSSMSAFLAFHVTPDHHSDTSSSNIPATLVHFPGFPAFTLPLLIAVCCVLILAVLVVLGALLCYTRRNARHAVDRNGYCCDGEKDSRRESLLSSPDCRDQQALNDNKTSRLTCLQNTVVGELPSMTTSSTSSSDSSLLTTICVRPTNVASSAPSPLDVDSLTTSDVVEIPLRQQSPTPGTEVRLMFVVQQMSNN